MTLQGSKTQINICITILSFRLRFPNSWFITVFRRVVTVIHKTRIKVTPHIWPITTKQITQGTNHNWKQSQESVLSAGERAESQVAFCLGLLFRWYYRQQTGGFAGFLVKHPVIESNKHELSHFLL